MCRVMEEKDLGFMKIGIDLDGTAWEHRNFFRELIISFQSRGHEIYILTAHVGLDKNDIQLWSRRGFPNPDGYISKIRGQEEIPSRDWKLDTAKKYGLDYIFDDFDTGEVRLVRINE